MNCSYCGCWDGSHAEGCPVHPIVDKKKMEIWWLGFEEAGSGRKCSSPNSTFLHGYSRGASALDTIENDVDPHQC